MIFKFVSEKGPEICPIPSCSGVLTLDRLSQGKIAVIRPASRTSSFTKRSVLFVIRKKTDGAEEDQTFSRSLSTNTWALVCSSSSDETLYEILSCAFLSSVSRLLKPTSKPNSIILKAVTRKVHENGSAIIFMLTASCSHTLARVFSILSTRQHARNIHSEKVSLLHSWRNIHEDPETQVSQHSMT